VAQLAPLLRFAFPEACVDDALNHLLRTMRLTNTLKYTYDMLIDNNLVRSGLIRSTQASDFHGGHTSPSRGVTCTRTQ
jgi:hypothetical protein